MVGEVKVDEKIIEAWALANREKAKSLGLWMVEHLNVKGPIKTGLGEFEDAIVDWARNNTFSARLLFMKLMSKIASSPSATP